MNVNGRFTLGLWCLVAAVLAPAGESAAGGGLRFGGYVKGFFTVQDPPSVQGAAGPGAARVWLSPVRLKASWRPGSSLSAEFAYELAGRVRGGSAFVPEDALPRPEPSAYRAADLGAYLYPASGGDAGTFAIAQNLDRAFLTVSVPAADIYVGRQAIAFGSARAVNPTDVVAPFTYETIDKEERVGVDALRVRLPAGAMGELDAGVIFGEGFSVREGAGFLRSRFYARETDFTLMAMAFREHLLLGLDLARSLGGAGAWLEAAWTRTSEAPHRSYLRASGGVDYQFAHGVYGFVEYHFNGAGRSRSGDYLLALAEAPFTEGGVYLLGRHYAAPGVTYAATPLATLSLQALVNLEDGSALLAPGAEYGFAQDLALSGGAFYGVGRRAAPGAGGFGLQPRSEFGLYPAIYFVSLRFYF